jgi:hypothetical protein
MWEIRLDRLYRYVKNISIHNKQILDNSLKTYVKEPTTTKMTTTLINSATTTTSTPPLQKSTTTLTELEEIHECLRKEITHVCELIQTIFIDNERQQQTLRLLAALDRFEALESFYFTHSQAEDEVLFPAFQQKGIYDDFFHELETQHERQHDLFLVLGAILRSGDIESLQRATYFAEQLRSSILLHLRLEEEELLPLLVKHFSEHDILNIVQRIVGDRGSRLLESMFIIADRHLTPQARDQVLKDVLRVAGPRFNTWLAQYQQKQHITQQYTTTTTTTLLNHQTPPMINSIIVPGQQLNKTKQSYMCAHYQRNCEIFAMCCNQWYTCTKCHNEHNTHELIQPITHIGCLQCGSVQMLLDPNVPFGGESCLQCHVIFGESYYCGLCRIWENNPQARLYHCPFCNACRLGEGLGQDYFHCMRCDTCISTRFRNHKCIEQSVEGQCPVCFQSLFDSQSPLRYIPCGHLMHRDCFEEYLQKHDYRCAICRRSMVDMKVTWAKIDDVVGKSSGGGAGGGGSHTNNNNNVSSSHTIHCNDCNQTNLVQGNIVSALARAGIITLVVGEKCISCGSYNTVNV